MSDVLTVLLVEVPRRREPTDPSGDAASAGEAPERQVTASVRGRGGTVIGLDGVATGGVFHLASDAALAGLEVIERLPVDARIAVCTGELASVGPGVAGPAVDRARELLRLAAPGQILVGGTTAVMVSHMLPPGCELVDLVPEAQLQVETLLSAFGLSLPR